MPREIYLVLVEFGRAREQAALDRLVPTVRRIFPDATLRTAIVDNAEGGLRESAIEDAVHRIGGDNSMHEFSGWDRGIAWMESRYAPPPDATFVLANDTVARSDKHDRVVNIPAERAAAAARGALVGWIDEYPRPVELFGASVRQWIDTSLLIAGRGTLDRLRPLARPLDDDSVFGDNRQNFFREPSPLSPNYRDYLSTYFFGERRDDQFRHGWYAQEPVTPVNADAFKAKLRCVFCEHLLGARARAARIPLVDIRPEPLPVDPF